MEQFIPAWTRNNKKGTVPFRTIAIRVRSRQRDLLDGDAPWRHFAVVTNMGWQGDRLLRWQREKQGTVELGHGVMKNDLGGGVLPCSRFGANAVVSHPSPPAASRETPPVAVARRRPGLCPIPGPWCVPDVLQTSAYQ